MWIFGLLRRSASASKTLNSAAAEHWHAALPAAPAADVAFV
jgi:hypothetical protein